MKHQIELSCVAMALVSTCAYKLNSIDYGETIGCITFAVMCLA